MSDAVLVLNARASSLRFALFRAYEEPGTHGLIAGGTFEGIDQSVHFSAHEADGTTLVDEHLMGSPTHSEALTVLLDWLDSRFADDRVTAVGHRVVHGGTRYVAPILVDAAVLADLRRLTPLAPLHQPFNLAPIAALARLHPRRPQVACFDTAFHQTQPYVATAFALPRRLAAEGVRRYGFHGLSYEYIAGMLPDVLDPVGAEGRVVVAHLGDGASMCALQGRRSIAATSGFSTLDGLPMSRRCGSLDPGVVLYLLQEKGMTAADVCDLLYHDSGLLGVSGFSGDMRTLMASDRQSAKDAVALFVYRIGRELGSLAAALGGIDALVFTAGIGEHAAAIRRRICEDAAWLGIDLDERANLRGGPCITQRHSRTSAWVIPTNEDLMIARHTWTVLNSQSATA